VVYDHHAQLLFLHPGNAVQSARIDARTTDDLRGKGIVMPLSGATLRPSACLAVWQWNAWFERADVLHLRSLWTMQLFLRRSTAMSICDLLDPSAWVVISRRPNRQMATIVVATVPNLSCITPSCKNICHGVWWLPKADDPVAFVPPGE
jgi:hypothetical protein